MARNTRDRILAAAAQEFAEKGFGGTTTRSIAERAEVNEVTLFRQFGTKQDLLTAVIEAGKLAPGATDRLFTDELAQLPPDEALLQVARSQIDFVQRRMAWVRIQLSEQGDPDRQPVFGFRRHLTDYLRTQQELRRIGCAVDAATAAEIYATGVLGHLLAQSVFPSPDAPQTDIYLKQFVGFFLQGLEGRP